MLTLTLQTSDRNNAVAVFDGPECLVQTNYSEFLTQFTSSSDEGQSVQPPGGSTLLLPMVKNCLQEASVTPESLDLIAVTQGPGMFTPLRVGVVAAKTMAFVHNIPLVGVDVLESLALAAARRQQLPAGAVVQSAVNAQRKQLFVAKYIVTDGTAVVRKGESELVGADAWADGIAGESLLTGPGLKIVSDDAMNRLNSRDEVTIESSEFWHCNIKTVAEIGQHRFSNDDVDDAWALSPIYFRPSAAEEVRAAK